MFGPSISAYIFKIQILWVTLIEIGKIVMEHIHFDVLIALKRVIHLLLFYNLPEYLLKGLEEVLPIEFLSQCFHTNQTIYHSWSYLLPRYILKAFIWLIVAFSEIVAVLFSFHLFHITNPALFSLILSKVFPNNFGLKGNIMKLRALKLAMIFLIAVLALDGFINKVAVMFVIDGKEMLLFNLTFADGLHEHQLGKRHDQ